MLLTPHTPPDSPGPASPSLALPASVLQGGYSAFVQLFPELCTPWGGYVSMADHGFRKQASFNQSRLV